MRLLQAASTHWAAAVMAVETAMARATRATMAKSTRWEADHGVDGVAAEDGHQELGPRR